VAGKPSVSPAEQGYEVTRFTCHVSRPELRIVELTLNSTQLVPWHIIRTSKTPSTLWRDSFESSYASQKKECV
jgi:hypothetical protein